MKTRSPRLYVLIRTRKNVANGKGDVTVSGNLVSSPLRSINTVVLAVFFLSSVLYKNVNVSFCFS